MQKYMLMFMLVASAICVVIGITKIIILIVKSNRWEGGASMRIRTLQDVILEEAANLKSDAKLHDTSDADAQPESDRIESDRIESERTESGSLESELLETELPSSKNNAGE